MGEVTAQYKPMRTDEARRQIREHQKNKTKSEIYKWTWEATQYWTFDEIREHVEGTLREVAADEV